MPAGTGVWVVNTPLAATTSSASRKRQPVLVHQDPDPLEAEERGVPLVHVADARPQAERLSARTPPMPSTISCRMRSSVSPP